MRLRLFLDRWQQGRLVDFANASGQESIIIRGSAPSSASTCC